MGAHRGDGWELLLSRQCPIGAAGPKSSLLFDLPGRYHKPTRCGIQEYKIQEDNKSSAGAVFTCICIHSRPPLPGGPWKSRSRPGTTARKLPGTHNEHTHKHAPQHWIARVHDQRTPRPARNESFERQQTEDAPVWRVCASARRGPHRAQLSPYSAILAGDIKHADIPERPSSCRHGRRIRADNHSPDFERGYESDAPYDQRERSAWRSDLPAPQALPRPIRPDVGHCAIAHL